MPRKKRNEKTDSGNVYDSIFKLVFEDLAITILNRFKDLHIQHIRRLSEKLNTTTQREADFLCEVTQETGDKFLLHIEFQSRDDKSMLLRMQEYHGILTRKYQLPVQHYVFYFGEKPSKMMTALPKSWTFDGFQLFDFKTQNFRQLLDSQIGKEIILAILADFKDTSPEVVIRLIIHKLREISQSEQELKAYLNQLTILSRLRTLEELTVENIIAMPITIDVKKDYLYNKGLEAGLSIGIEKGIERGIQQGSTTERRQTIIKMFSAGLTPEQIYVILDITKEEVLAVLKASGLLNE